LDAKARSAAFDPAKEIAMGAMHYPPQFSNEARAAVEAELIRAGRLHDERKRQWKSEWSFPEHESLSKRILSVFLAYVRGTIDLGKSGVWGLLATAVWK